MDDLAPRLLQAIRAVYLAKTGKTGQLVITEQTYAAAQRYAEEVGRALAEAFGEQLSSAVLPDGKLYWNIADRVVRPLLEEDHQMVADVAAQVQQALNDAAGIGIKAQTVPVDADRIEGILNKLTAADRYDDVAWVLQEPVVNFSQAVVDATLKANVDFQGKSGLRPRIIRRAESHCCPWCGALAGTYDYPDVPEDVYRRHERCRCVVEYDPGSGRRQNVHTKKLITPGERDMMEERKRIGLANIDTFRPKEYAETISSYVKVDREKVVAAAKEAKYHSHAGVYLQATRKSKRQLQKSIISRVSQVERHADKIKHPEQYVPDWSEKDPRYQKGLLQKWEKDMNRNAKQAEIELAVFEERF